MDKMRHILSSRSAVGMMAPVGGATESRSVFHINNKAAASEENVGVELRDCYQGIEEFRSALRNLDGAGTQLTESLGRVLRGTQYQRVGEQVAGGFREVYGSQGSQRFLGQLQDMEALLKSSDLPSDGGEDVRRVYAQTCCHVLLLFAKLQKQYFQMCHHKMAHLLHHLLSAKDLDPSGEVTKFILKLGLSEEVTQDKTITSLPTTPWGSPKLRKALLGSPKAQGRGSGFKLFSLFERKPSPEEGKSAFYVSVGEGGDECGGGQDAPCGAGDGAGTVAMVAEGTLLGSVVPLVTRTDEMNNECAPEFTREDSASGRLASEEDLDSVINLLLPCDMHHPSRSPDPHHHHPSWSPDPHQHPLRSPMQLTVPTMYRMRSPASDTQVDELQIPKLQSQLHRRSEGCLDLSSMGGGGTWPHPHHPHHHHRASLPAGHLHSPYRQGLDPYLDPPHPNSQFVSSPDFARPPSAFLGSGGVGGGGGMMMGGSQWSSIPGGGGGGGGGMEMRGSGTWPLYQPATMLMGQESLNSSWSGMQDGSDGSDDSSNGDHFFAVGKDIVNTIDSRHDSSEDEGDCGRNKLHADFLDYDRQAGSTNTWPMMQHLPGPGLHFPPAADYPDLLDPPLPPPTALSRCSGAILWPRETSGPPLVLGWGATRPTFRPHTTTPTQCMASGVSTDPRLHTQPLPHNAWLRASQLTLDFTHSPSHTMHDYRRLN
ncbi:hypothetical protein ACOMHN_011884 [Nucella lapillus]